MWQGTSHRHISDHLSELIETTINDLEESKCLAVEEDVWTPYPIPISHANILCAIEVTCATSLQIELSPLNLGMISSYYYIKYTTIELFAASVAAKTKVKGTATRYHTYIHTYTTAIPRVTMLPFLSFPCLSFSSRAGVIEILSSSSEFSHLTIRQGEDQQLRKLSLHIPNPLPASAGKNGTEGLVDLT
jgi:hypothetical protein